MTGGVGRYIAPVLYQKTLREKVSILMEFQAQWIPVTMGSVIHVVVKINWNA